MFYRLKPVYALRGWKHSPCTLVKGPENRVRPLTPEQFRVLMLCDGQTEFTDGMLSAKEQEALDFLLGKGVIAPSETPGPIGPEQEYRCFDARYVQSMFWSITGRCNYRCRRCYMDAPEGAMGELSHEEAVEIIRQMARCGVYHVDLTGGEPFVRPDFWELIDELQSQGIRVGKIYTNGWLLDGKVLDRFEERGMKPAFSLSFDGVGWHDWMRGVKGAEEAALRALRLCVQRGFFTDVEMCVHKGNAHTLRETIRLLGEIGVGAFKCSGVSGTELWKKNSEGNDYGFREYCEDMIAYIPQYFEDGCPMEDVTLSAVASLRRRGANYFDVIPERYEGTDKDRKRYLCGATRAHCYITPDGRLLPCMPMTSAPQEVQERFPKIAEIGLEKCLDDSFFMEFVDRRVCDLMEANQKCRECPHVLKCGGGCRAGALECTGDLMGGDDHQCMLWNEGWVERIRRTAEDAVRRFPPKESGHEAAEN